MMPRFSRPATFLQLTYQDDTGLVIKRSDFIRMQEVIDPTHPAARTLLYYFDGNGKEMCSVLKDTIPEIIEKLNARQDHDDDEEDIKDN